MQINAQAQKLLEPEKQTDGTTLQGKQELTKAANWNLVLHEQINQSMVASNQMFTVSN